MNACDKICVSLPCGNRNRENDEPSLRRWLLRLVAIPLETGAERVWNGLGHGLGTLLVTSVCVVTGTALRQPEAHIAKQAQHVVGAVLRFRDRRSACQAQHSCKLAHRLQYSWQCWSARFGNIIGADARSVTQFEEQIS